MFSTKNGKVFGKEEKVMVETRTNRPYAEAKYSIQYSSGFSLIMQASAGNPGLGSYPGGAEGGKSREFMRSCSN
jgi:hypothetical protein